MRIAEITRNTTETQIHLTLDLDGNGSCTCDTGVGFLDHMLTLFARHGHFNLDIHCTGDTGVDCHHSAEDLGIVLGRAFAQALGEMRGICRYGSFLLPMDETLVMVALDISGRPHLGYALEIPTQKVGDFDTELVEEFFLGFVRSLGATLHLRQMAGGNSHHIIEAAFKGFGRALAQAVAVDPLLGDAVPSTKGTIK